LNLCFVCNEYPPAPYGGIGNGTQLLGRALVRAGHTVRVVGVYRPCHAGEGFENDMGVEVHRLTLPARDAFSIRARAAVYRRVAGWSRKSEIQMVEVPDPEGWAAGWPTLRIPVIGRIHGSISYFAGELQRACSRLTFLVERASLRRADFWSSVSQYAAESTRRMFALRPRGTVLYPAVNLPAEADWNSRSSAKVVYAGTLTLKKGILSLVRAWSLVCREAKNAELQIFGKDTTSPAGGPMSAWLLSHVDAGARASIVFRGHAPKSELVNALRTARAAVFPSYAEAFAATPMEAMAEGCPTVYSSRTSGAELIDAGRDGLLIDPDRPDEIANAVLLLLSDEDLARRLGAAGREKVRTQYSTETVVPLLSNYYRQCIDRFENRGRVDARLCSSQS
jgi:glycosyltransferase involved in cell wall biosynthesis